MSQRLKARAAKNLPTPFHLRLLMLPKSLLKLLLNLRLAFMVWILQKSGANIGPGGMTPTGQPRSTRSPMD
jgi:hypothetical protein